MSWRWRRKYIENWNIVCRRKTDAIGLVALFRSDFHLFFFFFSKREWEPKIDEDRIVYLTSWNYLTHFFVDSFRFFIGRFFSMNVFTCVYVCGRHSNDNILILSLCHNIVSMLFSFCFDSVLTENCFESTVFGWHVQSSIQSGYRID